MSNETLMATKPKKAMVGEFTPYTCDINKTAGRVFNEAMEGLVGVKYFPVAVSEQMVTGTNYRFFCNTKTVTLHPTMGAAIVLIFKPLDGAAILKAIHPIE